MVAKPDPKVGRDACAFVELKAGARPRRGHRGPLQAAPGGFKVPRAVVFGELPKTSTGKIQKFELRKQAVAQPRRLT